MGTYLLQQLASPADIVAAVLLIVFGIIAFILGGITGLIGGAWLDRWYTQGLAASQIAKHPGKLVDPADPDAIFVEIVPRENWLVMKVEEASEVGFLKIEPQKREILLEGDSERFRIPGKAIRICKMEEYSNVYGNDRTDFFIVVLQLWRDGKKWEMPVRPRLGGGKNSSYREEQCRALRDNIQAIRS